ncbi:carboxypeptidase-like regulatory domain-containing protein [Limnochorda pilosa]|uniref:Carboxypeptidase regulatory-like domain-containing protein n=1 Tax=Limnochorda pilosa TaxID=1555112 RepID=A0A0K2SQG3_LIMPI|nr:carboxypeptidase-like regulatory domain-containing protein [Limnochorda pilosa]BAS29365.1 hypothetical protein LIP_3554 [Limnochorda pilosa]
MQNWLVVLVLVGLVATVAVPAATYQPPDEGITITGRVVNAEGEPLPATVSARQTWGRGISSTENYWKVPHWRMPQTRTDRDGYFELQGLHNYPQMENHMYYVVARPDDTSYDRFTGFYVDLTKYEDGAVVDWGTIVVNRTPR